MNYSIHAQKAPNKDATSSMPLSTTHSTAPPAASVAAQDLQNAAVSDSGSTSSSHGDAASMFSSSRISSSNTSVSSADSPPAKLELNGQQLTVNPALLMRAPSTSSHPLPQKPVAAQAPSGPPSQPSASSKGGGGGLVKGKESAKKDKKKSETKYKSAAIIEDEESDFEPQSKAANKRKSAPSTGSSSQPTAIKRPKPQPKTKATIEKGSSSGRDSSSKAPRIESRTAGGARICGKPSPKPSNTPAPSSSAVPSPAGTDEAPSKKRKIPEPVAKDKSSAANKKVKREAVYYTSTEDEDEDADGEVDDSFMTSTQQPTDRGRPGEVKRTHLSKSSAAASLHEKNHKPSSKNASPDGSKVAAADANIAVSNPYTNHQEYAEARATFVKQYEDYEAMRRKLEMKQGILRRLLRGDDLSNDERIQIPSKREVTNMVAEATERRSKLAETKQHLWAFARVHKSQHS